MDPESCTCRLADRPRAPSSSPSTRGDPGSPVQTTTKSPPAYVLPWSCGGKAPDSSASGRGPSRSLRVSRSRPGGDDPVFARAFGLVERSVGSGDEVVGPARLGEG